MGKVRRSKDEGEDGDGDGDESAMVNAWCRGKVLRGGGDVIRRWRLMGSVGSVLIDVRAMERHTSQRATQPHSRPKNRPYALSLSRPPSSFFPFSACVCFGSLCYACLTSA